MLKIAIALTLIGAVSLGEAAPRKALPSALAPADAVRVRNAAAIGKLIYDLDRAGWVSSDALVAQAPPDRLGTVRGWVVEASADGAMTATYFDDAAGARRAVFTARVRNGAVVDAQLSPAAVQPALTAAQQRMAAALTAARAEADAKGWRPCAPVRFNTVVVPPAAPDAPVSVYLLTPQTENGKFPLGGHYRVDVGADGRIVAERAFTNSCLTVERQPGAAALYVTHLLDPTPTELHVFMSLTIGLPVLVGTRDGRTWAVDGASVTAIAKGE